MTFTLQLRWFRPRHLRTHKILFVFLPVKLFIFHFKLLEIGEKDTNSIYGLVKLGITAMTFTLVVTLVPPKALENT